MSLASITQAAWEYATRTLVEGSPDPPATRAEEIAQAVWEYESRTLTGGATTYTYAASGGATAGGAAGVAKVKARAADGGAESGGAAPLAKSKAATTAGGASSGGTSALSKTKARSAAGGAASGGTAASSGPRIHGYAAAGGATAGGAASTAYASGSVAQPVSGGGSYFAGGRREPIQIPLPPPRPWTFAYVASGGVIAGGSALTAWVKAVQPRGGAVARRSAAVSTVRAVRAHGGAVAGGAAPVEFHVEPPSLSPAERAALLREVEDMIRRRVDEALLLGV